MSSRPESNPDLPDTGGTRRRRMPAGLSFASEPSAADNVRFLADTTWVDAEGHRHNEQEIFDAVFDMIRRARRLILLDMFLYNDFEMQIKEPLRTLSHELTEALLEQKKKHPGMTIIVITDPINTVYGSIRSRAFEMLEAAGVRVVTTSLVRLPDSNPAYSVLWRLLVKPFGRSSRSRLRNPFDPVGKISLRSYLEMLNCKANHRKVVVCDDDATLAALVTSANPHDASSANSNVAVRFFGPPATDLLASENAVLTLSGHDALSIPPVPEPIDPCNSVQVLTEGAIKTAALAIIDRAGTDAKIDIAAFYVSDRDIIAALKRARLRGARLRLVLDPNKDAFGYDKHGIPNRPAAAELRRANIDIRWYHTHGEQCHIKMLLAEDGQENARLLLGSANLTRRNLGDFNLETNVLVEGERSSAAIRDARAYFDTLWHNREDRQYTEPYERYRDESLLKKGLYRFMEASGFSEF
jgi:phosphatidylserine/phosphatidylglycerophosphate/cardiolipin synthase-like enzyme